MVYHAGHLCHTMWSEAKRTFPLFGFDFSEFNSSSYVGLPSLLKVWAYMMSLLLFGTCRFVVDYDIMTILVSNATLVKMSGVRLEILGLEIENDISMPWI